MKATLIDSMGSDLSVVNAARVSFAKTSEWEEVPVTVDATMQKLSDKDKKLIDYLARNNHWTPFGHVTATFHFEAPIFVARQLAKHQVGLVWNEVSRRYVSDEPEFYLPEIWRGKPTNGAKQGSSDDTVAVNNIEVAGAMQMCAIQYNKLLADGVAPEMARMILPQNMYTEWYWTGSLAAWARIYNLRMDSHAQSETRDVISTIGRDFETIAPVSFAALTGSV